MSGSPRSIRRTLRHLDSCGPRHKQLARNVQIPLSSRWAALQFVGRSRADASCWYATTRHQSAMDVRRERRIIFAKSGRRFGLADSSTVQGRVQHDRWRSAVVSTQDAFERGVLLATSIPKGVAPVAPFFCTALVEAQSEPQE